MIDPTVETVKKTFAEKLIANKGLEAIKEYCEFIKDTKNKDSIDEYIGHVKNFFRSASEESKNKFIQLLENKANIGEISSEELQVFKDYFNSPIASPIPATLKNYLPELINSNEEIEQDISRTIEMTKMLRYQRVPDEKLPPIFKLHSLARHSF